MTAQRRSWRGTRVMKARRTSTCPICRGPVTVGQQIASRDRGRWMHIEHVLAGAGHQDKSGAEGKRP